MDIGVDDEAALVELAVDGDVRAFEALYRHHVGPVSRFLVRRLGAQDAEDATAETFLRAWGAVGRYEPRGVPFRAWLFRLALNVARGTGRRRSLQARVLPAPTVAPDADDPTAGAVRESATELRLLAPLSGPQRMVIELRFIDDLGVAETGQVLGISDEAVRAMTYRALQKLRASLKNATTDQGGH